MEPMEDGKDSPLARVSDTGGPIISQTEETPTAFKDTHGTAPHSLSVSDHSSTAETPPFVFEIGTHVSCKFRGTGDWRHAQILSRKEDDGLLQYYVHYLHGDKRNDEWLAERLIQPREAGTSKTTDATAMEEDTEARNIDKILFGCHWMNCWYSSPFPPEILGDNKARVMHMCEYCLLYTPQLSNYLDHRKVCKKTAPPGRSVYCKDELAIFELDGRRHKLYCQCLSLLSKLFLDGKTLFFDVENFYYYVLTVKNHEGRHCPVGYFSKEKQMTTNNLSCILTFPPYQGKGYGRLLIQFSYELSKRDSKYGTPEKPLSDLGRVCYYAYWKHTLIAVMHNNPSCQSLKDLCDATGMLPMDVVVTLNSLGMIQLWDGQFQITVTKSGLDKLYKGLRTPKVEVDPLCVQMDNPVV
eukprot:TRINITY_DN52602_c0_g1_i1.p1 TRINITY_DN52602_c0_g1~~TRINITY_DN52602_c0_g1_i1.p1  ORF type:complete len:411 (-),score=13.59 TRINITY_DN52602_c0_g1_i1:108-1340(-)